MGKMVSASEFQAKCLQLIDEMQQDGEPVAITRDGRVVAELAPKKDADKPLKPAFGILKSDRYRFDLDPSEPMVDPDDWEVLR